MHTYPKKDNVFILEPSSSERRTHWPFREYKLKYTHTYKIRV